MWYDVPHIIGGFRAGSHLGKSICAGLRGAEKQALIEKKKRYSHSSHRQISGYLAHEGYWVSESSCYRILRVLVGSFLNHSETPPGKNPTMTLFGPNEIWGRGLDQASIEGLRHYLLTIIDYFSLYIGAGVLRT
nr:hypothetical protein [Desulfobacterales bacterium]